MLRLEKKRKDWRTGSHVQSAFTAALIWCIMLMGIAPVIINAQTQVSGNIHPNKIEIDVAANLGSGDAGALNAASAGNPVDWQKDNLPNTDPATLIGGVATGINTTSPNQTGAPGGKGHWYGARLVDGFLNGKDTDIFLQGGKVNDPSTWVVGPGSTGSAKFDATEAYMANNQTNIFFGMERAGNSGTTAFDFEFNQNAPAVPAGGVPYIPNRSTGDKLISFELQGSGGASGTVLTYIFTYNGTVYVPLCDDDPATATGACPAGLFTSINGPNTPAGAWGREDGQNAWVTTAFDRRLFAEAQVPLSLLPNVSGCGDSLFVQIRTRSSSSLGSDAKDTSPIFEYLFGGPTAAGGLLSSGCGLNIGYDGSASTNSGGTNTNLTYAWTFQQNVGGTWTNVGSSTSVSGTFTAPGPGTYRALLVVTEGGTCVDDVTTNSVTVYNDVGGSASLTPDCDDTFGYSASGTGGSGLYNFAWTIYKENGATDLVAKTFSCGPALSCSGQLDIDDFNVGAKGEGNYYAVVQISDSNNSNCVFPATSNAIDVRYALTASASKSGAVVPGAGIADAGFVANLAGSTNALAGDTVTTEWQYFTGGAWTPSGDLDLAYSRTMADIFSLGATDTATTTILTDSYNLKRGTLQVRLHAVRTLNGQSCPVDSAPVLVKAIKAIDP